MFNASRSRRCLKPWPSLFLPSRKVNTTLWHNAYVQHYLIAFTWLTAACPLTCLTYPRHDATAVAFLSINKKPGNTTIFERPVLPGCKGEHENVDQFLCLGTGGGNFQVHLEALVGIRDHGSWRCSIGCQETWIWEWLLLGDSNLEGSLSD